MIEYHKSSKMKYSFYQDKGKETRSDKITPEGPKNGTFTHFISDRRPLSCLDKGVVKTTPCHSRDQGCFLA